MNFWWPFGIKKSVRDHAQRLLTQINEHARAPELYEHGGIPDTLDGRFQTLGLFAGLAMTRIEDKNLRQALFDRMFMTCEISLRQMGIGDLGIPYKLKAMFKAFHGHAMAYKAALNDPALWDEALIRNVYGTLETPPAKEQLDVVKTHIDRFMKEDLV